MSSCFLIRGQYLMKRPNQTICSSVFACNVSKSKISFKIVIQKHKLMTFNSYKFVETNTLCLFCDTVLNTNCMSIILCLKNHLSNRTLGQRALVAGEGEGVSRGPRIPQRTSSAPPQTSRFSFHCFVNLFSFLAKLTIYKRRLVEVSHKESMANFYNIFSGIKKLFLGKHTKC